METSNSSATTFTVDPDEETAQIRSVTLEERRAESARHSAERERRAEEKRNKQDAREAYKEKKKPFRRGPSSPLFMLARNEDQIETNTMMDALPDQRKAAVPHGRLRQHQVIKTVGTNLGNHHGLELKSGAVNLLNALQSTDPIEAMIDGLIVGCNNVAMKSLERAVQTSDAKAQAQAVASAIKTIQACTDLMKYREERAAGPRSVTVTAVKVEAGGQAIVGNVQSCREPRDG